MDELTEPAEDEQEATAATAGPQDGAAGDVSQTRPEATAAVEGAEGGEGEGEGEGERPKLSRRKLVLLVAPIVVLAIVGTVTTALTPALAAKHPLLLIILEARNRNLILAREVDLIPFVLAATFRRLLTDPLYYLLGYYYGDAAVRWLEVKAGLQDYARLMERLFRRAAFPAVFFFPGAVVCALAGVVRMRFRVFLALNVAGTLTAVLALKAFGEVVASPVEALVGFFERNIVATTTISIVLVTLSVILGRVQGKTDMSMKDIDELGAAGGPGEPAEGTGDRP